MSRSRRYVFTLNNPDCDFEYELIAKKLHSYIVCGQEVGESGTPHIQGYIEFAEKKSLNWLKQNVSDKAHFEVARGSSLEASDYCKKDGLWIEDGERSKTPGEKGDGEKRRWEDAFAAAKRGALDDIDDELRVRYYSTWKQIQKDFMGHPDDLYDCCGVWLYGESGNGKSHAARDMAKGAQYYEKMANKWWDGYQNEPIVILDDVDPKHDVLGHHLKIWADKYAFIAEAKGNAMRIRPRLFIVTSQYPIERVFQDAETIAALKRRFKEQYVPKSLWRQRPIKRLQSTLEDPIDLTSDVPEVPGTPTQLDLTKEFWAEDII